MDLGLKGKVAIVTGSAQGIGRVVARTFAQEGANVVIADIQEDKGKAVAQECQALGVKALFVRTDVTKYEDVENLVKTAVKEMGKVDALVHDAATFVIGPFRRLPRDTWNKVINICLFGAMNCGHAVAEPMAAQKKGHIVFVGSDAGRIGDASQTAYSAAKGGIMAFSKSLAQELGPSGITVNVLSPGLTLTAENTELMEKLIGKEGDEKRQRVCSLYALRKLGTAEDVANVAVFLASDRAGHVTGQVLSVSGGYSMVG
ncbi:MAG: SDR family oxidoreductase [Chloroflexi bacterium]|nr:SDR family oxidoreductase [Chloroflexota bacterium]